MSRRPSAPEFDSLVKEFQHDAHRPRAADALLSLRKIASLVKPIMRQRNWHVGLLCEFYPEEANLLGLNVNRGQKICLRLRYPNDERQFLPIEEVVDTMLHELCHNVHGPHDQVFHALWNQLRDEHEALLRKGYTGEGFLSQGKKLGGSGRIPMHEARRRARAAAEKRQVLNSGSGQRLGGKAVQRGTNMRRVIADAAQRRTMATTECASGTDRGKKIARDVEKNSHGFRTKAEEDDANERAIMQAYIELLQEEEREKYGSGYVPPSESNPAGPRAITIDDDDDDGDDDDTPIPGPACPSDPPSPIIDLTDISDIPDEPKDQAPDTWVCEICTLVNPLQFLSCDACTCERPTPISAAPSTHTQSGPRPTPASKPASNSRPSNHDPRVLRPRQTLAQSLTSLDAQERRKEEQSLGWLCYACDNWMESQWWTCAQCGTMKLSSS